MLGATIVLASDTFFVFSFFEKLLCKSQLCRFPELSTRLVLLLKGHSRFLVLLESLAFEAKLPPLAYRGYETEIQFCRTTNLSVLRSSLDLPLWRQAILKTIRFPLNIRRSCRYCNHCSLSCGKNFFRC